MKHFRFLPSHNSSRSMRKFFWLFVGVFVFGIVTSQAFGMSSANYQIDWDSLNTGGQDTSSSTNYNLKDTLGELGVGRGTSASYEIRAGYREGITDLPILNFSLSTQSNASQVAYSAFSNGGTTVTIASASGFAVNDFIAVVENEGTSQMVAIGKISGIAGSVITVDMWDGDNASMSAAPSGGNDYVYLLNGSAAALGTLSASSVKTAVTRLEATTNSENGYTAYITEDGEFRSGSGASINEVTDGAVTVGSEEYGIETTGGEAQGAGDFVITSGNTAVAASSGSANQSRTAIIYKASVDLSTASGDYSHIVTYLVTANF